MFGIDVSGVATPCYICDLGVLERNLRVLSDVRQRAGCKILLALKGFAMWSVFPLVRRYLDGVAASSLHEARLGSEELGGELHVCAPAYDPGEIEEIASLAGHLIFNSFTQLRQLAPAAQSVRAPPALGIRVNPEHSEVEVAMYDPCAPGSRLGVTAAEFRADALEGVSGLHFHTLCELGADALERTLAAVERAFGAHLQRMEWVNMGGGHHITRADYDVDLLVGLVRDFARRYDVQVYLEPGEAIALDAGVLVATVLDIVRSGDEIAILDTSAAAHMPDVLEMPYRPRLLGAGNPGEHPHTYVLGGLTCQAGDLIGAYSFPEPLRIGQKLVFQDMAHYTMVKNTTFNGLRLPSIATHDPSTGKVEVVREFGYEDYRRRLS
jgi:carboxynorspermidine decarboxylase